MKKKRILTFVTAFSLILLLIISGCSNNNQNKNEQADAEDDYPNEPITIYIPFSSGGVVDLSTRALAEGPEDELGVKMDMVERRGRGGSVAMREIGAEKPEA